MAATLVTGAAGFAGSHLLELLAAEPPGPLVAWRRPSGTRSAAGDAWAERLGGSVDWQEVDLLDKAGVERALDSVRPSIVYHCAGAAHVGRAWQSTEPTFATNAR